MSQSTDELRKEWQRSKQLLKTMRDEIKVKLHLLGMDAKDRFEKLDAEAERMSREIEKTSKATLDDLIARVKELRDQLKS